MREKPRLECVPIHVPDLRTLPFIVARRYMTYEEIEAMYGPEMAERAKEAVQNASQSQSEAIRDTTEGKQGLDS